MSLESYLQTNTTMTPFPGGGFDSVPNISSLTGEFSLSPLLVQPILNDISRTESFGPNPTFSAEVSVTAPKQTSFTTENLVFSPGLDALGREVQSGAEIFRDLGRTLAIPLFRGVTTTAVDVLDTAIHGIEEVGRIGGEPEEEGSLKSSSPWHKMIGYLEKALPAVASLPQTLRSHAEAVGDKPDLSTSILGVLGIGAATLAEIRAADGGEEAMSYYLEEWGGRVSLARELAVRSTAFFTLLYTHSLSQVVNLTATERGVMWASIGTLFANKLFDKIATGLFHVTDEVVPDEAHVKWIPKAIWTFARNASWYIALANLAYHRDMFFTNNPHDASMSLIFFGLIANEIWRSYTSFKAKRQHQHRPF